MKIFNSKQIKYIDEFTIINEPISSMDLMERASSSVTKWISENLQLSNKRFLIFVGPGNNGGDGLAVARLLHRLNYTVKLYVLDMGKRKSPDFEQNLVRLKQCLSVDRIELREGDLLPNLGSNDVVIDAIFGSGLNRPVIGYWASLFKHINESGSRIVSIDMPSGLFADKPTHGATIEATYTLTFQQPKLAFFVAESKKAVGRWYILDIGLHPDIIDKTPSSYHMLTAEFIAPVLKARDQFDHKGTFGHALLICGGYGMVGAAMLAAKACLRSGVGKLTVHIPKYAYTVMQVGVPEAMVEIDEHEYWFSGRTDTGLHQAVGIGCGIGQKTVTSSGLRAVLAGSTKPLVIDADAINILAKNTDWLRSIPTNSILTPHPGEYERLFGHNAHSLERLEQQIVKSVKYNIHIVLKGACTCITTPAGEVYFNSTGNPGMATAGSGDVLTGIITGLLAQGLAPREAAISGVYLHGLAGDLAAKEVGQSALIASDIIDKLGAATCLVKPEQS